MYNNVHHKEDEAIIPRKNCAQHIFVFLTSYVLQKSQKHFLFSYGSIAAWEELFLKPWHETLFISSVIQSPV